MKIIKQKKITRRTVKRFPIVVPAAFAAIVLLVAAAVPSVTQLAFADPQFKAQDDKNNDTYPGEGAGNKEGNHPELEEKFETKPCIKNPYAAQCY